VASLLATLMPEIRTVTTLRRERFEIAASIKLYERVLAQSLTNRRTHSLRMQGATRTRAPGRQAQRRNGLAAS
jgi:hypothetical protein